VSKKTPLTPLAVSPVGAARLMGVSRAHVYNLIKAGELSYYKDGSRTLILVANIEARIRRLSSGPPPTKPLLPVEQQRIAMERAGEPDYAAIYAERLKLTAPHGEGESRRRALADTIRAYRRYHDCAYKPASVAVRALIPPARLAPIDPPQLAVEPESPAPASLDPRPAELASASGWRGKI
jgi:excisionase family DNA binding protein